jgi:hypothetical protein
MSKYSLCLFAVLLLIAGLSLSGAEYYIDNVKGNDANQGTKEAPFKTFEKVLKVFKGGDTLHMVHNEGHPYRDRLVLAGRYYGTAEKRTVIDGHGAIFDGRKVFPASAWKNEGNGIFSRPFGNNAHVMDYTIGCWSGDFPIVFFEGKDGVNCRKKEELKPFSYFLLKIPMKKGDKKRDPLHNTLYIKLPDGKTPDDIKVETVAAPIGLGIQASYVTVRNLRAQYTSDDCFDTCWGQNIIFDNVEGAYAMDQGISSHSAGVTVKNSWFHHNTGCGIVDVNMPKGVCRTKYINCLIENNFFRGGVEFHRGEYEMENCVIRNNTGKCFSVNKNAKVKLTNCLLLGQNQKELALYMGSGGDFQVQNCTICDFGQGLLVWLGKAPLKIKLSNCAFINNKVNYSWNKPAGEGKRDLKFDYNFLTPAAIKAYGKIYKPDKWDEYRKATGLDTHSQMGDYRGKLPPCQAIDIEGGQKTGANIDLDKVGINSKLME